MNKANISGQKGEGAALEEALGRLGCSGEEDQAAHSASVRTLDEQPAVQTDAVSRAAAQHPVLGSSCMPPQRALSAPSWKHPPGHPAPPDPLTRASHTLLPTPWPHQQPSLPLQIWGHHAPSTSQPTPQGSCLDADSQTCNNNDDFHSC